MRLLDLVEEHHRVWAPPHRLRELPALLVPHVPRGRADQARDGVLLHVLAHVDPHHGLFAVEEELGEGARRLRLPHPRGAQEDEGADGAVGVLHPRPRAAYGVGYGLRGLRLADHPPVQVPVQVRQPLAVALQHPRHGDPGPLRHHLGDVVRVHLLLEEARRLLQLAQARLRLADLLLQRGDLAVLDLGGAVQVARARGAVQLHLELVQPLLAPAQVRDHRLLALPLRLHPRRALAQLGDLLVHAGQAVAALRVALALQGVALDLQLHGAPLHLVDLLRQRIDLDAQLAGRLVDQVDGLVGQEAVADVAVAERGRGHDGRVRDAHPVVHLVALLEAAQDADGVFHAGLAHEHGLEAPLQRRVLFDVLAVLVQRGGAHQPQLAAGQRRLQHVPRVGRPLRLPRPHDGVELVDEDDELAVRVGQLLEDGLETLLELAAVLGAGQHGADVQRHQRLVAQPLRYVAVHDALRQPLRDGRLPHPRLADEHGVVLGAAAEHLHHPPDLLVAADDGVELPAPGALREVHGEALEGLVLVLGVLVRHPVRAAHLLQRVGQRFAPGALGAQQVARGEALLRQRQQQVLGRDVLVLEVVCLLLGAVQHLVKLARKRGLRSRLPGEARRRRVVLAAQPRHVHPHLLEDGHDDPLLLVQQRGQQVRVFYLRIAGLPRGVGRRLDDLAGLYGKSIEVGHAILLLVRLPADLRGR